MPEAGWQSRIGQARYADAQTTLTGDVSLRVAPLPETYTLEFSKAGNRLLLLTRKGDAGWATGLLARNGYAGPVINAPDHLQPWFTGVARALTMQNSTDTQGLPKVELRLQP